LCKQLRIALLRERKIAAPIAAFETEHERVEVRTLKQLLRFSMYQTPFDGRAPRGVVVRADGCADDGTAHGTRAVRGLNRGFKNRGARITLNTCGPAKRRCVDHITGQFGDPLREKVYMTAKGY
jgi:hypothetical protein